MDLARGRFLQKTTIMDPLLQIRINSIPIGMAAGSLGRFGYDLLCVGRHRTRRLATALASICSAFAMALDTRLHPW